MPISEIATDPRHPIRLLKKSTHVLYPVATRPVVVRAAPVDRRGYGRPMKATVRIDNEALRSAYEEVASAIELVDQSLRKSFSGLDLDAVVPEVRRSFAEIGLDLSDAQLEDYSRSISERRDFEFVLE